MEFQSIRAQLEQEVTAALVDLQAEGWVTEVPPGSGAVTPPKQAQHGDYASNAALLLARGSQRSPRELATALAERLAARSTLIARCDIAGPGFVNLFVAREAWHRQLLTMCSLGSAYLRSPPVDEPPVLVEFVSANPTGPLHIAHGRGAVIGDVLARLLRFAGYRVATEYYVNDMGHQVEVFARSIHYRYCEILGDQQDPPEEFYPGDYVTEVARALVERDGAKHRTEPADLWLEAFGEAGVELMLARIASDLERFGVRFDRWVREREVASPPALSELVDRLETRGHVYEHEGRKWFRTTTFGDDKDRVVVREDGRPTYFASDIAYHDDKARRGFSRLINVFGADHGGYVARVRAGLAGLGHDPNALEVVLIQMVSLSQGGAAVKMGKRLGTAVWLRDVLDEAGVDATRFFFIMRRADSQLDFDIDLARQKSLDNPVFYAQMGHARLCSIGRRADAAGIRLSAPDLATLGVLALDEEIDLIKHMDLLPERLREAAAAREPHRVTQMVHDLIAVFHTYFTKYKGSEKVVSEDPVKSQARLHLCAALQMTIRTLLVDVCGVSAPEEMYLDDVHGVDGGDRDE